MKALMPDYVVENLGSRYDWQRDLIGRWPPKPSKGQRANRASRVLTILKIGGEGEEGETKAVASDFIRTDVEIWRKYFGMVRWVPLRLNNFE
jgi:hypothetical protein